jgi:hypothetical protein
VVFLTKKNWQDFSGFSSLNSNNFDKFLDKKPIFLYQKIEIKTLNWFVAVLGCFYFLGKKILIKKMERL